MAGRPTAKGYHRYLRLQAAHGSPGRALEALNDMKRNVRRDSTRDISAT